jgi:uncharacterized protein (DUF2235 family)
MRNIVICCDWISSESSENISNVLKFYHCLRKRENESPQQLVYYDPGVGGPGSAEDPWDRLREDFKAILGLATGYGLDDNVLSAYEFLIHNYQEGDQIYLFGFSHGAYIVRMVAGLIHAVGLLSPEQINFSGSGLIAYKRFSIIRRHHSPVSLHPHANYAFKNGEPVEKSSYNDAAHLAPFWSTRWPTIRFVGVWDTVASLVVPRPDRFYLPSLEELAFMLQNPSVQTFRQAISIDERRCMFRLKRWDEPQVFMRSRLIPEEKLEPQDCLQVWFAGVHADIGGGYPEMESALSKYPLIWMIEEAAKCGLSFNPQTVTQLAWGIQKNGPFRRVAPDVLGIVHESMTPAWRVLEYLPKNEKYKEWPERQSNFGFYIPDAEPRLIPEGAILHESVVKRMHALASYRPINLPKRYGMFPMSAAPDGESALESA